MGLIAHRYETFYAQLFAGLRQLGYEEGRNLVVERRYAEGHAEQFPDFAAEMVRLNVDVIIVVTTPAALAVKKATTTIPVVFPNAINPVETSVVASLARPRDNVTGGAIPTAELSAKRLELFKEVMPALSRAGVLWNSGNPSVSLGLRDTRIAAEKLGINDAGDPNSRANPLQKDIGGHLKQEIPDEEQTGAQSKGRFAETNRLVHMQLGETDIDAVQISNEIAHDQKRDQSPSHATPDDDRRFFRLEENAGTAGTKRDGIRQGEGDSKGTQSTARAPPR